MLDGVIRKDVGRQFGQHHQPMRAQRPCRVIAEDQFARIGRPNRNVAVARVADRPQDAGDEEALGRALVALHPVFIEVEVERAQRVASARIGIVTQRFERSLAVEPLLRRQQLQRVCAELRAVGCCQHAQASASCARSLLTRRHGGTSCGIRSVRDVVR